MWRGLSGILTNTTQLNQAPQGAERGLSIQRRDWASPPGGPAGSERLMQARAGECEPRRRAPHWVQLNSQECVFIPVSLQPHSLAMIKAFPNPTVIFKSFLKQNLSKVLESIKLFTKTPPTRPTLEAETGADRGPGMQSVGRGESPDLSVPVSSCG